MLMLPVGLRAAVFSSPPIQPLNLSSFIEPDSPEPQFHFQPHYPGTRALDAVLLRTKPGLDEFVSEIYHNQIAALLSECRARLLQSADFSAFGKMLSEDFLGSSLRPVESRLSRRGPVIEIYKNRFSTNVGLRREAFRDELRDVLKSFTNLVTAEFQITQIEADNNFSAVPERVRTSIRYDLVGEGVGFHREQRVGYWDLTWKFSAPDDFRIQRWQTLEETRSRSVAPVFSDIGAQTLGANASYSGQLLHGADYWRSILDGACGIDIYGHNGVSVADIDNDGFDDLYVCQPAGLPNRLYRNRGDGTFEDVTESSGLGLLENTACALFADFNNSGRQDVVVVATSGPRLFVNEGGGKFRYQPGAFQFADPPRGTFTGAAAADYDRDGFLDIYFCLYIYYQGTDQYKYPVPYYDAENGPPNFMMKNNRDGSFRDVTAEAGLNQNNTRYSFCCGWNDFNGDGWPDLYVVNDFGRKNLYRNNGDGTFTDVAAQAGVEDVGAGMSVCWFDHVNHGASDLYVGDMWTAAGERISRQAVFKKTSPQQVRDLYRKHAMGNSLFRNEGVERKQKKFRDVTASAGVGVGRWAWSSDAFDFDHDGFLDLYIVNGMISGASREDLNSFFWRQVVANSPDQPKSCVDYEQGWSAVNELVRADGTWSGFERNVFYANNRDGTFSDVSGVVGLDFLEDGRAFALADFDHDGRQEIFLKNRNAPQLRVLKNQIQNLSPSIVFGLRGTKSNRDAIGAVVTIETEAGQQLRTVQAGSGFLSQHSKELSFGLGESKGPVQATILWPSGSSQRIKDLPANHRIFIEEGSQQVRIEAFHSAPEPNPTLQKTTPAKLEQLPTAFATWLLVPVTAPPIALPDLSGKVRSLSQFQGKAVLLNFWSAHSPSCVQDLKNLARASARWNTRGLQLMTVNVDESADGDKVKALATSGPLTFPILLASPDVAGVDVAGVYNLLYRYLFDRHRDLSLPTSFLIDVDSQIVRVYQGPLNVSQVESDLRQIPRTPPQRLARALPFAGVSETFEFARNHLSFGSIFFQRGYYQQAETSFQLAIRDDPANAEAYYGLGSACLKQNKNAEARENFERAVKLPASYPDTLANAWNNLGLLAAQEKRNDEAIRCFQEALRSNPDHLIALINLGSAYRVQKNWDAARQALERALLVDASDAEANYGLAMVYAQSDDTEHADEYLQRALKARPDYPEALNNLGILYLRTQRRDQAVARFEECIRVAPGFDQAYLSLAKVYALEGDTEKAKTTLLDLLKRQPDHPAAKSMLAQLAR